MSVAPPPQGEEPEKRNSPRAGLSGRSGNWSLPVAVVSGIPIRLHFTFLLMIIYFAILGIGHGGAGTVLFLLGIFGCVALHELGHSLVAQRLGYKVRDIVLYPIGGVAAIEGAPRARHELAIAVAGPLVNVVIAAVLYAVLSAMGNVPALNVTQDQLMNTIGDNALSALMVANIVLVLFNMIPAFPLDGGRVLRAALALKLGRTRGTKIAAFIGRALAVVMALYGLGVLGQPLAGIPFAPPAPNLGLVIISLFVFFTAGQEAEAEQSRIVVQDVPASAAMMTTFETLAVGDSLRRAAEVLLATAQQDFPVVHGGSVVGVLSRSALLRGLAQEGDTGYVSGSMERDIVIVRPDSPLEPLLSRTDGVQRAPIIVLDAQENLVGMITMDNLMEFFTLRQIERERDERSPA